MLFRSRSDGGVTYKMAQDVMVDGGVSAGEEGSRSFVAQDGHTIRYEPLAGTAEAKERYGAELKRFGLEHGDERLKVVSDFEPAGDQLPAIRR